MVEYVKQIAELKEQLSKEIIENSKLKSKMWVMIEIERRRIDDLIKDIETRFNAYMEEYSKANDILTKHSEPPVFRTYTELDSIKPIEYGEIRIPELHIRFIKGEREW